jgi:hypothetical protein
MVEYASNLDFTPATAVAVRDLRDKHAKRVSGYEGSWFVYTWAAIELDGADWRNFVAAYLAGDEAALDTLAVIRDHNWPHYLTVVVKLSELMGRDSR